MSLQGDRRRAALGFLTAWLDGDQVTRLAMLSGAVADLGDTQFMIGQVELAAGILKGVEAAVDRILSDPEILRGAFVQAFAGKPFRAAQVRADAESTLARVGQFLALDGDTIT